MQDDASRGDCTLVQRLSGNGKPFSVLGTLMAKLIPGSLDCVIYLYRSERTAKAGESAGGSGFLVSLPSDEHGEHEHIYAVTNSHVIEEGYPVIRLNTQDGKTDTLNLKGSWVQHPDGHDIAVAPIIDRLPDYYTMSPVPWRKLLRRFDPRTNPGAEGIGPGGEVYLLGRFINHEGKQRNSPSMRHGHIAMMADENNKVLQEGRLIDGKEVDFEQESFLVEVHTIGGYSGSPVFVYFSNWADLDGTAKEYLLGIEWGGIPQVEDVVDEDGKPHPAGWQVAIDTGMAGVVPAWHLRDLILNSEDLKMARKLENEKLERRKQTEKKLAGKLHTGKGKSKSLPLTREGYEDALKKVFPRPSESESESDETSA
jgi:hypothetical protein